MYLNRNTPTLSGLVAGSYNTLSTSTLVVTGDASIGGNVSASSISGNCITSSLTSSATNVAASASALSTVYGLANGAITTAGGVINGPLTVMGQLNASNLSVLGSYEYVRAYETHTSNLVIENAGTGPALKVTQTEGGPFGAQPVADFYNGTGVVALRIDNNGNVAVNKTSASTELDVSGCVTCSTLCVGSASIAPGFTMDVSGYIRADGFLTSGLLGGGSSTPVTWDTSGSTIFTHSGSNVGIGRAPGAYALDVSGSVNISTGTGVHPSLTINDSMTRFLSLTCSNVSAGLINGIAQKGDQVLMFSNDSTDSGALAICPWSSGTSGIRINGANGYVGINKSSPAYALDVNGGVNASSIVVGGSSAKQMDCGSGNANYGGTSGAINISFNFTFANIPKVVATAFYGGAGYMFVVYVTGVTTTGFTGLLYQLNQSATSITGAIQNSGIGFQWIAIG